MTIAATARPKTNKVAAILAFKNTHGLIAAARTSFEKSWYHEIAFGTCASFLEGQTNRLANHICYTLMDRAASVNPCDLYFLCLLLGRSGGGKIPWQVTAEAAKEILSKVTLDAAEICRF